MDRNNQMYKMFKEMKEGYKNQQPELIEHGARCWLDCNPDNPFPVDSPEYEAFFQMQKCYLIWIRGDVNRKINRRKMVQWAMELCKINPRQPYKFDKKAEEADQALRMQQEAEAEQAAIQKEAEIKQKQEAEVAARVQKEIEHKQFIEAEKNLARQRASAVKQAIVDKPITIPTVSSVEDEKQVVMGVLPEDEKTEPRKSNWFSRLFRKKEGGRNDGKGTD